MTQTEAILHRSSIRTFNGLHLDRQITGVISDYCRQICAAPQPDEPEPFKNVPRPVIFLMPDCNANGKTGTYGVIKGACTYLVMACGNTDAEQTLGGYLFEKIILRCTALGIDTCWLGGTFSHSGFQAAFMNHIGNDAAENRTVAIVSPIGHRTPKKRFAERMFRAVASSDKRKPFDTLFQGINTPDQALTDKLQSGDFSNIDTLGKISLALECVRLAPSSTNSQPWRAKVVNNAGDGTSQIQFSCASTGKFAPYDMGIAYAHFTSAADELGLSGSWSKTSGKSFTDLTFITSEK